MKNLWKQLNEEIINEENVELDASEDNHIEDFVKKQPVSNKAKECAIQYLRDAFENDDFDDYGVIIDAVYEWSQFDSLDEIFDYIKETGETEFSHELREGCSEDLWSVYNYKLSDEVEAVLCKYNDEFYNLDN